MAQQFLTSINLNSNELQNALLHPLATAPSVGAAGKVYYNTTENVLYISDGSAWRSISGDITSITAGDGLTGGGSLGDVTLDVTTGDGIYIDGNGKVAASITNGLEFDVNAIQVKIDNSSIEFDGNSAISLKATGVTADTYGSSTAIPVITVDADGRITLASTQSISTDLDVAGDTGTDTISLASETLTFTGGDGVTTSVAASAVTIDVDSTVVRTSGDQTIAGNKTFSNNVIISGDLIVSGAQTTKVSENVLIEDNIITLNSNETGIPSENAGIEIERGAEPNAQLIWNEAGYKWQIEVDPTTDEYENIATENYVATQISNTWYATKISGDATTTNFVVTHGLNTRAVMVQVYDELTYETVYTDVTRSSTTTVTIGFSVAPGVGQDYQVLIQKLG